jgi:sulfur carrier protein
MLIKINGKKEAVDKAATIGELVSKKGLLPEHIVVEHNYKITPKDEWDKITLNENDNIEIVSFVGGG